MRHICIRRSLYNKESTITFISTEPLDLRSSNLFKDLSQRKNIVGILNNIQPSRSNVIFGKRTLTIYGRNYLIPKGLGVLATVSAVKILKENLKQQEQKEKEKIDNATKTAELLPKLEIIIPAKVADLVCIGQKKYSELKKK